MSIIERSISEIRRVCSDGLSDSTMDCRSRAAVSTCLTSLPFRSRDAYRKVAYLFGQLLAEDSECGLAVRDDEYATTCRHVVADDV